MRIRLETRQIWPCIFLPTDWRSSAMMATPCHWRWTSFRLSFAYILAVWVVMCGTPSPAQESTATSEPPAAELPRYRFEVGQELVYERTAQEDLLPKSEADDDIRREDRIKWWVWVTRKNNDGSWRILIRKHVKMLNIPADGEPTVRFENDFLGSCDLHADGSFASNPTLGDNAVFEINPQELFVQLPKDATAIATGWQFESPIDAARYSLKVVGRNGDLLQIAGPAVQDHDANYVMTRTREIQFDTNRGVPIRIVWDNNSQWQRNPYHLRTTVELTAINNRELKWIDQLEREASGYLDASKLRWKLSALAVRARTESACQNKLDETRRQIVEPMQQATLPEIRQLFDALLTLHDREAKGALDEAAEREEFYAQPPINWETTDFDGQPHRLADYRGKIVVLDFWYRGCGHCILALPKFKELAARYDGENVAFLGMNQDSVDEDARYVIDHYKLSYSNLRGQEIASQYQVNTGPTFIVLDQTGRIADVNPGNSDDLVEHITGIVDELLTNPATEPAMRSHLILPIVVGGVASIAFAYYLVAIRSSGRVATSQTPFPRRA